MHLLEFACVSGPIAFSMFAKCWVSRRTSDVPGELLGLGGLVHESWYIIRLLGAPGELPWLGLEIHKVGGRHATCALCPFASFCSRAPEAK